LSYMIYFKNKKGAQSCRSWRNFIHWSKAIMLLQKLLCVSKVF
jgi:hypothetical protein